MNVTEGGLSPWGGQDPTSLGGKGSPRYHARPFLPPTPPPKSAAKAGAATCIPPGPGTLTRQHALVDHALARQQRGVARDQHPVRGEADAIARHQIRGAHHHLLWRKKNQTKTQKNPRPCSGTSSRRRPQRLRSSRASRSPPPGRRTRTPTDILAIFCSVELCCKGGSG